MKLQVELQQNERASGSVRRLRPIKLVSYRYFHFVKRARTQFIQRIMQRDVRTLTNVDEDQHFTSSSYVLPESGTQDFRLMTQHHHHLSLLDT